MDYDDDTDFTEIPAGYHIAGEDDADDELGDDIIKGKKAGETDDEDEFDFEDTPLEDDIEADLY